MGRFVICASPAEWMPRRISFPGGAIGPIRWMGPSAVTAHIPMFAQMYHTKLVPCVRVCRI
uniref:Uncharacterized protein n=1 Tax=Ralstonia solanacearum TaxID=305 RepID=A0A0S4V4M8_RALSL|nr:protein of unknown function [Ralstonia solanacearum]